MAIVKLELYITAAFNSAVLLFLSLAELDALTRFITGLVGVVIAILTGIRVIHKLQISSMDKKIKKLEQRREEEKTRRYFETKYSSK